MDAGPVRFPSSHPRSRGSSVTVTSSPGPPTQRAATSSYAGRVKDPRPLFDDARSLRGVPSDTSTSHFGLELANQHDLRSADCRDRSDFGRRGVLGLGAPYTGRLRRVTPDVPENRRIPIELEERRLRWDF